MSTDGGQTFRPLAPLGVNPDQPKVATDAGSVWVAFQQTISGGPPPRDTSVAPSVALKKVAVRSSVPPVNPIAGAVAYSAKVTGLGKIRRFGKPEVLSDSAQNISGLAVDPAGQVMVSYQSAADPHVASSTISVRLDPDGLGKQPFAAPVVVGTTNTSSMEFIPAQPRRSIDAQVTLAYDNSGGPFTGRAYLCYTDQQNPADYNTDIFIRYSDDDGATWSDPIQVNHDATPRSQFFPRITVDPTSGLVGVSWYDCRNDNGVSALGGGTDGGANNETQFYASVGEPASVGVTFSANLIVSPDFSNPGGNGNANDYGDYTSLAFVAGILRPAWADHSNIGLDNPDGFHNALDAYSAGVPVASDTSESRTFLGAFGSINPRLVVRNSSGVPVALSLNNGIAYAFANGPSIDLKVSGTTDRSNLNASARGKSVTLGNLTIRGSPRRISAKTCSLAGIFAVSGSIGDITLGAVDGGRIVLAGGVQKILATSLNNAKILSGASLTPGGNIGTPSDVQASGPGLIKDLEVSGAVTASFISAGFNPADDLFVNTIGTISGGRSSAITLLRIRGGADLASNFVAGAFNIVRIPKKVNPAQDSRFHILAG